MGEKREPHAAFKKRLQAAGGELLAPTNPYEVLRFRTHYGVGVVYCNSRGKETWNREALAAQDHILRNLGSVAPVAVKRRKGSPAQNLALIERDGSDCFFCLEPLGDDITREHLVSVNQGGPNHISNKFLAHQRCNNDAGHLSAPEKIRIRERALLAKWACSPVDEAAA
jgi:5-methylcytosine-specific restriction endonuclease McrA